MADGGSDGGDDVGKQMKKFASRADGKELTTKDLTRWAKDAKVLTTKQCNSNNLDICFSKHMDKKKKTLDCKQLECVLDEIAAAYGKDNKMDTDKAKKEVRHKMACTDPKTHGTTTTSKTGNVKGMTDTSKYTGSHKERFDESGKGKGIAGRKDLHANDGYVGEYKEKGTYDKKH